jgi:predicted 3-demethylubiquinone-9 3-methyltransferase (glyoxalase superfamily)
MQKVVPHLWYDKEAKEAALFYISLFENSRLVEANIIEDTPSGDAEILSFELAGQRFEAISGGPFFHLNPSISMMVACDSIEEVNALWEALSEGGVELMPRGEYPFSKWYCWIQDKFGLSWQLVYLEERQTPQKITTHMLFSNEACGKANEAITFYTEVFKDSKVGLISHYEQGQKAIESAEVMYATMRLADMNFSLADHGFEAEFSFNEAFSIIVYCENQEEIDYYWDKLSAVPESEQCGWVKDKFGVSWQIVPFNMGELMSTGDAEKDKRVFEAMMQMKKLIIKELKEA